MISDGDDSRIDAKLSAVAMCFRAKRYRKEYFLIPYVTKLIKNDFGS